MNSGLSLDERQYLLALARKSIHNHVEGLPLPEIEETSLTENLAAFGASFVTLTISGHLRGCIGSLEAYQSLVEDVREHAVAAAFEDYRFSPVTRDEFSTIEIEISRLTQPVSLDYSSPDDLPGLLRPGVDGVILKDGYRRATFLPQVWEQLPNPEDFLTHLCAKMGAPSDLWRKKLLQVSLYQVEEFHE